MRLFMWVYVVLCGLCLIGRIEWLRTGNFPQRTATETALDVVVNVGLMVWAVVLLA